MTSKNSYLKNIDSVEKAYCLGFFLNIENSKSSYANYTYELTNIDRNEDKKVLNILKNVADIIFDVKSINNSDSENDSDVEDNNDNELKLSITLNDDKIINDIKDSLNKLDSFTNEQKIAFLRGLYEYSHLMNLNNCSSGDLILIRPLIFNDDLVTKIFDFVNIPYVRLPNKIIFKYGCSSVDFLGFIYNNNTYKIDEKMCIHIANYINLIPSCNFIRTEENAVVPIKANWSDVGYDLSIIKKVKDFNSKTALYDTGIKIQLDFGYYAEIVPRSSISKSGYILSNNIGIIDNSYRGNLLIALTKIADDAIDIEYPFKCCQLIFKKQIYVNMKEVPNSDFESTKRNEGGFGSSG
jgi:deoxyuridine 5'-triphosphate nucleotidohydrolase